MARFKMTFLAWVILLVLPACSVISQASAPAVTQVVIDGKGDDWATHLPLVQDMKGDQPGNTPDLGEIRAFSNDQYLYLYIKLNNEGITDHYDILMNNNGDFTWDYQLSIWPAKNEARFSTFPVKNGMELVDGVTSAQADIIEMKMPLSLIGGKKPQSLCVQTYDGKAVGDMAQGSVPPSNEIESTPTTGL